MNVSQLRDMSDYVIVGAGVIGLTTALAIREKWKTKNVTIVAEFLPDPESEYLPYYTSPWAGAHFRPFPSKNEVERREYPYSRETYRKFKEFSENYPESTIRFVKGIEYFENPDELYLNLSEGYTEHIDNFRVLDKSELPRKVAMGVEYDTFVLNAPRYIEFLRHRLEQCSVKFVRKRIEKLKDASVFGNSNLVIINCSGNGLQWGGGLDSDCFVIRGQTLLIRPPTSPGLEPQTVTHQLHDNQWTFTIPRPMSDGMILGGTKQPHDSETEPRSSDTQAIIQRGEQLFAHLMKTREDGEKYFDIIRTNVGFRPARKGGLNVSREIREGRTVVHGYGCGGSGFEFSYGVALTITQLLEESHRL